MSEPRAFSSSDSVGEANARDFAVRARRIQYAHEAAFALNDKFSDIASDADPSLYFGRTRNVTDHRAELAVDTVPDALGGLIVT